MALKLKRFQVAVFGTGDFRNPDARHSIGLRLLQRYSAEKGLEFKRDPTINGYIAHTVKHQDHDQLYLVQQENLHDSMGTNRSGSMVKSALNKFGISTRNFIVCHDCLLTPIGRYKLRKFGKTHRQLSLTSILNSTRTDNFYRLGIGVKTEGLKLKDKQSFLANPFDENEQKVVDEQLDILCGKLDAYLAQKKQLQDEEYVQKKREQGEYCEFEKPTFLFHM